MVLKWTSFILILIAFLACESPQKSPKPIIAKSHLGYQFLNSEREWGLPPELTEVSGIACWNNHDLLVVEDEHGLIYHLNQYGDLEHQLHFAEDGDYEGLCLVGKDLWVVRSDGYLFKLQNWQAWDKNRLKVTAYQTALKNKNDLEGICYDAVTNSLLIACKGRPFVEGENVPGYKAIYRFDLEKEKLYSKAAYLLDLETIELNVKPQNRIINFEKFKPSDIAIHPQSREIYLLSSSANMILVLQQDGSFSHTYPLLPQIFEKPEGICFDLDANLYCSSEGKKAAARIWKFPFERID